MIVHIITGLGRGGAERTLYQLLARDPSPSSVHVVSLTDGGIYQERLEALGIKVVCMRMPRGRIPLLKWWKLIRVIRRLRPDIVQTWMYHADLIGGVAAAVSGVPVVWGIRHSDLSRQGNSLSTLVVAKVCAVLSGWIPTRAISCSRRAVESHRAFGYVVPVVVVPNGVDEELWRPRPELRLDLREALHVDEAMVVFAHAGRGHPLKGHEILAESFNEVFSVMPNARLLVCGEGLGEGDQYLDDLPFTATARKAVIGLGPRDDLHLLWNAADAFVLSSISEGFPNVLAEAMACGLPCVSTGAGDAAEIVGAAGEVVAISDSRALSAAMLSVASLSRSERCALGKAARERVLERFTLPGMVSGFRRVWADVVAKELS